MTKPKPAPPEAPFPRLSDDALLRMDLEHREMRFYNRPLGVCQTCFDYGEPNPWPCDMRRVLDTLGYIVTYAYLHQRER